MALHKELQTRLMVKSCVKSLRPIDLCCRTSPCTYIVCNTLFMLEILYTVAMNRGVPKI